MPMGGGAVEQKVVTGSFTFTTSTTVTIPDIKEIDFIMVSLGVAITIDSNSNFSHPSSYGVSEAIKYNDEYFRVPYNASYPTYGIQIDTINGNSFQFNHWNNTSQTVYYYVIGR